MAGCTRRMGSQCLREQVGGRPMAPVKQSAACEGKAHLGARSRKRSTDGPWWPYSVTKRSVSPLPGGLAKTSNGAGRSEPVSTRTRSISEESGLHPRGSSGGTQPIRVWSSTLNDLKEMAPKMGPGGHAGSESVDTKAGRARSLHANAKKTAFARLPYEREPQSNGVH